MKQSGLRRAEPMVFWQNLRLRWKLMAMMLLLLLTFIVVFFILYANTWNTYDDYLSMGVAKQISSSAQGIEAEMRNLQKALSDAATSNSVQEAIRCAEQAETKRESHSYQRSVLSLADERFYRFAYILSIHYVNPERVSFSAGFDRSTYFDNSIDVLYELAVSNSGRPVWVFSEDNCIVLCEIRETRNLSLRSMGMLAVRIQFSRLVSDIYSRSMQTEELSIYEGEDLLYGAQVGAQARSAAANNYTIVGKLGDRRIMAHIRSSYYNYDYYCSVAYDEAFGPLRSTRRLTYVIILVTAVVMALLSIAVARSIARPLQQLTMAIERTPDIAAPGETGKALMEIREDRRDEIGIVMKSYQEMLVKLGRQIDVNYTRKLMLKETQLSALQAQINPHFLYNTLDSIYWLAENEGQQELANMIFALGRLLRASIQPSSSGMHLIRLEEELKLLGYYISIQKVRFRDDIDFEIDTSSQAMGRHLPRMILQPLVENAVHYGVEMLGSGSWVRVEARVEDDMLAVCVVDNGIGVPADIQEKLESGEVQPSGTGIGLKNIYQRLQFIYEGRADLKIRTNDGRGTVVEMRLPELEGEDSRVQGIDRG